MLAWGAKVSATFRQKVEEICWRIAISDPSWLMACMAFESAETFSPSIINRAGSGAVGLIQFMPGTAAALGTTTEDLARMTAEQQLDFVRLYFEPWAGRLHNLGDVYAAILYPSMIGKPDGAVIFDSRDPHHPKRYLENRGLDLNHDGKILRGEITARVQAELTKGLQPGNVYDSNQTMV